MAKQEGRFHVVHFRREVSGRLISTKYEVYFENKPFLKTVGSKPMSRRMARSFCRLLNGEARWPA